MASAGLQILEIIPVLLGGVNALMSCVQPLWKVTVFISNGIVVAQVVWEGLWMFCMDKVQGVQVAAGASPGPAGYQTLCILSLPVVPLGLRSTSWEPSAPPAWRTRIPGLVWCSSSRSSLSSQRS